VARVATFLVVLGAAAAAAAVALAAQSPNALRAAIFSAARAQHSVHYVARTSVSGVSVTTVGDVAAKRGIQHITFRGNGRSGRATVLVLPGPAYMRGDEVALQGFFGLTASQAGRYTHVWISIPRGNGAYAEIAAAVTLGSFLDEIYPQTKLVRVSGAVGGRRVIGVRGLARHEGQRFVETLYARAQGRRLPVLETDAGASGFRSRTTIGPWNGTVHVRAPANPVPISRVVSG
jgi:hypothetical protein